MFAFESVGEGTFFILLFVGTGLWAMSRQFKKFDSEGKIQKTAQEGIMGMVSRFFKK